MNYIRFTSNDAKFKHIGIEKDHNHIEFALNQTNIFSEVCHILKMYARALSDGNMGSALVKLDARNNVIKFVFVSCKNEKTRAETINKMLNNKNLLGEGVAKELEKICSNVKENKGAHIPPPPQLTIV